jgi:hypothetical protein
VTPGVATATASAGPFNGNLANVAGANLEPTTLSIEPTAATSPSFINHRGKQVMAQLPGFPARVTGGTNFFFRAKTAAAHLGRSNSIAADQGQPINLDEITGTGRGVTINSPLGGSLAIGQALQVGKGAVLLGGDSAKFTIGNNVSIGANSVVAQSSLGDGTVIGSHAYIFGSTLPAGTVVPDNAIIIGNKAAGTVQW